jgi:hypothetical protein
MARSLRQERFDGRYATLQSLHHGSLRNSPSKRVRSSHAKIAPNETVQTNQYATACIRELENTHHATGTNSAPNTTNADTNRRARIVQARPECGIVSFNVMYAAALAA